MEKINALIDKLQELKNSNAGLQIIAYHTQLLQSEILRAQVTPSSYTSTSSNIAVIMPARATAPMADAASANVTVTPAANAQPKPVDAAAAKPAFEPAVTPEAKATPVVNAPSESAQSVSESLAANAETKATSVVNAPSEPAPSVSESLAANAETKATPVVNTPSESAQSVSESPAANAETKATPTANTTTEPARSINETFETVANAAAKASANAASEPARSLNESFAPAANAGTKPASTVAPAANATPAQQPVAPLPSTEKAAIQPAAATPPPEHARYIPTTEPVRPAVAAEVREATPEKTPEKAFITVHSQDFAPDPTPVAPEKPAPVLQEADASPSMTSNRPKTIVGKNGAPNNTLFDTPVPTKENGNGIRSELHELAGKNMASLNDRLRTSKIELGEKLGDTRVTDLRQAIGINDKFQFIQELFRGDVDMYERSIRTINEFTSFQEADLWIQRELKIKLGWQDEHSPVKHFYVLLKKRFS